MSLPTKLISISSPCGGPGLLTENFNFSASVTSVALAFSCFNSSLEDPTLSPEGESSIVNLATCVKYFPISAVIESKSSPTTSAIKASTCLLTDSIRFKEVPTGICNLALMVSTPIAGNSTNFICVIAKYSDEASIKVNTTTTAYRQLSIVFKKPSNHRSTLSNQTLVFPFS
ncbi:hypothetical protein MNB_SUP05-13-106 [hydrothermal vent metagenome]|uniref:Uncharacterized protein n=1 Tax=hydrothermal vent metagenome TaxID=652676 RepID=A0A1W1DIC0_9ZZZZ